MSEDPCLHIFNAINDQWKLYSFGDCYVVAETNRVYFIFTFCCPGHLRNIPVEKYSFLFKKNGNEKQCFFFVVFFGLKLVS